MPTCPCCGEDPPGTEWKPDPLRWELDPPCSKVEWDYLYDLPGRPEYMEERECTYMNKLCRGCYNERLDVMRRIQRRIRDNGGIEEMKPTMRMRKEYENQHAQDIVANRAARIQGLQSAAAASLNGQYCKLIKKDAESGRWTVELVSGEQKAIKEANIEVSLEIDKQWITTKGEYLRENPDVLKKECEKLEKEERRPLGEKTTWPKIPGIHPGAVVRIHGLASAKELNGRKGRCIAFDSETGRWKVDFGDEQKSLKPANFTPAPNEKPPTRESALKEKKEMEEAAMRSTGMSAKEMYSKDYGWDG